VIGEIIAQPQRSSFDLLTPRKVQVVVESPEQCRSRRDFD
jgi:hypothetical protein